MNEIDIRCLVERKGDNLYIARCLEYEVIARGADKWDAAKSLLEVFVGTYGGYRANGRDMLEDHPRALPYEGQMVEFYDVGCTAYGSVFNLVAYTTPDSIKSLLRAKGGLWSVVKFLPGDYDTYGGDVVRDTPERFGADCACGCKWFTPLYDDSWDGGMDLDWGVCTNPDSHRAGLLTWEHQGCLLSEPKEDE